MNICGIVCEYNPFHLGHAWQIGEIRRLLGEDAAIVCVMSGDFVQRGEAAAYAKHVRAHAAVCGGADLVFELPLPWAISSAERFAEGAVGLLGAFGCVTHLAFGSECADAALLDQTAELLLYPELDSMIREELKTGNSYAAARQKALEKKTGTPAALLTSPNDILALEYLKALKKQNLPMQPVVIARHGAEHDSSEESEYPSASLLREKLAAGLDIAPWLPYGVREVLQQGGCAVNRERLETAILSRLRFLPDAAFAKVPDAAEGLEHRLADAARTSPMLSALEDAAATKRYPRARIRRMALCAALGVERGDNAGIPPYLRLLAADKRGLSLLHAAAEQCTAPVITKPSAVRGLGIQENMIFSLGAAAADLYALGFDDVSMRTGDRDWKTSPIIV